MRRALVGVLPVLFVASIDPSGWSPFGPIRWAVVLTVTLALGASFARDWSFAALPKSLRIVGAIFLGWMTVATIFGADRMPAWVGTAERHLGLLTWVLFAVAMVTGAAFDDLDRRCLAWGCVLAAWAVGLYVAWERVVGPPIALANSGTTSRVSGPFGSAVFLGATCCLLVPVSLGVARDSRSWRRLVALGGGVIALFAMVASGSRGPLVALGVVGLLVVIGHGRRAVLALTLVGLVSIVAIATIDRSVFQRTDAAARADEWRIGMRAVERSPLLGVGPEGYRLVFPSVVDDAYVTKYGRAEITDRAHSAPLDLAIIGGLPAGLLYGALLVLVGRRAWVMLREEHWLSAGVAAGVVAYGLQSLVLFPLADVDPLWWLMIGSLLVERAVEVRKSPAKVRAPGFAQRFAAIFVAFSGLVGAMIGVLDVAADRDAKRAMSARMQLDPSGAANAALAATRARADSVRYRVVAARALSTSDEVVPLQAALHELDAAATVSPRDPSVIEERARVTAHLAVRSGSAIDLAAARAAVDAFVKADLRNPRAWLSLADIARRQGDMKVAGEASARAEQLRKKS